jgi:phytanoyl-CoA dioxygenase PhyH
MNAASPTTAARVRGHRERPMPWEFAGDDFAPALVRRAFALSGIVLVRDVLNRDEVRAVRGELDRAFAGEGLRNSSVMCPTELHLYPLIWSAIFKSRIVRALNAALGPELRYYQDLHVARNSYGQCGWKRHTGWHMDSGSEGANAYLRAPGYRFAKCGIFLQDFDNGWGGGIRIKPKSHRGHAEPAGLRRRLFFARRAMNRAASIAHLDFDTLYVPVRAGDFCFFDSRLLHSSVPPSRENIKRIGYDRTPDIQGFWRDIPPEHTKYVLYWDASNADMVVDFMRNSVQRAERELPGMVEQDSRMAMFTRYLAVRFPDDLPADFVMAARERQIGIVTLSKAETDFYKSKLRTMQLINP